MGKGEQPKRAGGNVERKEDTVTVISRRDRTVTASRDVQALSGVVIEGDLSIG